MKFSNYEGNEKGGLACFVFLWVPASAGMIWRGLMGMTDGGLGSWCSELKGWVLVVFGHPLRCARVPFGKGRFGGVLCFSLGSRVRGNDVRLAGMTDGSRE